jgi:hypothetical protein
MFQPEAIAVSRKSSGAANAVHRSTFRMKMGFRPTGLSKAIGA